ncbi:MAG: hypothetical protein ACREMB_19065 [Candidatus Rokuibacteriota bacterium]
MAVWAVAWTLFEWWAVIGWPEALETRPAALILGGVATLVGLVVWRGVREPGPSPDEVIPLRRLDRPPESAADVEEDEDLAA